MSDFADVQLRSCRQPILEMLAKDECPHCGHSLNGALIARRDVVNRVATDMPIGITHTLVGLVLRDLVDEKLVVSNGRGEVRISAKGKRELAKLQRAPA